MGDRGGQNMIEPAAYGAAVSFGPRTENFREVVALMLAEEAAKVVVDGPALTQFLAKCLESPTFAGEIGERAKRLVAQHKGATSRTIRALEQSLGSAALKIGLAKESARRSGDERKAA
jgi:3-deoxy-D-manno-octulosonic-acid transferase